MILLGIDTGGTFTDFILHKDGKLISHKVLSTPKAPELAILQGIRDLGIDETDLSIVHGSTVATNAVLEGKGVSTAYITNYGFADVLSIGRQTRRELYNLQPEKIPPPVAKEYCLETGGRVSALGEVLEPLTQNQLDTLLLQLKKLAPEAVAINLLFSYINGEAEKRIAEVIPQSIFVSRSSEVLAEYKEYERGIATWLNSYVGPLVNGYIKRLQTMLPKANIAVMQSSGGTMAADTAGQKAVHMLLSGPAGGLAAAKYIGEITAHKRLLTFDMGGTSTDVSMIDGELELTNEGEIAGYPVAVPMVDMHTIGAGGGSIASIDAGGLLQVGPESAGADPGPACYAQDIPSVRRHKKLFATVTDANLVLGRLDADSFLGGEMRLNIEAARQAIEPVAKILKLSLEETATGIIRIANEHMAHALRVMSVQRGIDPRELCLVSFGGAGGLHVCALADLMAMQQAMVPRYAGVLSALGMLLVPRARQLSQTLHRLLKDLSALELAEHFSILYRQGLSALVAEDFSENSLSAEYSLDLRYFGQSYFLNVRYDNKNLNLDRAREDFQCLHEKRYGHRLEFDVELVNLRLALTGKTEEMSLPVLDVLANKNKKVQEISLVQLYGIEQDVPVMSRDDLYPGQTISGPALITETVSTTYLAPGWVCEVDRSGNLLLNRCRT